MKTPLLLHDGGEVNASPVGRSAMLADYETQSPHL
jgi:hypothetical protein